MKRFLALMICMIAFLAMPAWADGTPLLDPGPSFFSAGEWLGRAEYEGSLWDIYAYNYEKESSTSVSSTLMVYQIKVERAGYSFSLLEEKSASDGFTTANWYGISDGELTAQLFVSGSYFASSCEATLYVPAGMEFTLSEEVGSRGGSSFQNDIYVPADEVWIDGGSASVVCLSCHGSGKCGICGGSGRWKNPYTGDWLDCDCGDGVCEICDGKGDWGD